MSMANAVRIKYQGEILCCLDQTEVKAVEPYVFNKFAPKNLLIRIWDWAYAFITGVRRCKVDDTSEEWTKVLFKDGSFIKLKIPFLEFVNGYC